MTALEYFEEIKRIARPMFFFGKHMYNGKNGHERFAREIGAGLSSFSEKEVSDFCKSSYSSIYVTASDLRPILSANEWIKGLMDGMQDYKDLTERMRARMEEWEKDGAEM